MIIKRCDRCGEEIRENGNWLDDLARAVEKMVNAFTGKPNIKLTNSTNGIDLDLCPACKYSLIQWMKFGQAIQKAKNSVEPDAIIRDGKRYELKKEEHPEEKQEPEQEPEDIKFGGF